MNTKSNNIATIQWLRGIAAMMVVIHHARNNQSWLFNPIDHYMAFAWGVDIFFVISGFIMFVAAREERGLEFLRRRFIRVAPLYWIFTLLFFIKSLVKSEGQAGVPEVQSLIMSLFFIPHFNLSEPGHIWPILIPGWTLNYEMFFYFIFFVGILNRKPLGVVSFAVGFLLLLGFFVKDSHNPIVLTYTSFLMSEFLAGMWIGKIFSESGIDKKFSLLLPVGFVGLLGLPLVHELGCASGRVIFSSFIVVGAISISSWAPKMNFLEKLGDASYSIYLSHAVIGLALTKVMVSALPLYGWLQFAIWIALSIIICGAIGYATFIFIERPLLRYLKTKF